MEQLDPAARDAWARFRLVMRWMLAATVIVVVVALAWLRASYGPLPLHMAIATTLGVALTMLLGTGLMALVFVSRASGHDDYAAEQLEEDL